MAIFYKQLVRVQIGDAKFPYTHRQLAEKKILEVLRYLRVNQKIKNNSYCPKRRVLIGCRPKRLRAGRPKLSEERTYLLSSLSSVWMQAFDQKPKLNRRGEFETPYVKFAGPIMASVGINNTLDTLNKYRLYVNRISKIIDKRHSVFVTMPSKINT
jgi:hypothetical protein